MKAMRLSPSRLVALQAAVGCANAAIAAASPRTLAPRPGILAAAAGLIGLGLGGWGGGGVAHARPPIGPAPGSVVKAVPLSVSSTARGGQAWDISLNPNASPNPTCLTDAIDIVGAVFGGGQPRAARWKYSPDSGAISLVSLHPTGMPASGVLAARFEAFGGLTFVPNPATKAPPPLVWQASQWLGNAPASFLPFWGNSWEYSTVTDMGTGVSAGWQHQIPNNGAKIAIPWKIWRLNPAWIFGNPTPMKNAHACLWPSGGGPALDLDPTLAAAPVFVYGSRVLGVSGDGQTQTGDWYRRVPGYQSIVFQHACLWNGTQASFEDRHPYKPNWTNSVAYDAHGGFGSEIQVGMHVLHGNTTIRRALAWSGPAGSWTWKEMHPAGNWASEAWSGDGFVVGYTVKVNKGRAYAMVFDPIGTAHLELPDPVGPPGTWAYTYATSSTFIGPDCGFVVGYGYNTITKRDEPLLWTVEPPTPSTPCYADCDGDGVVTLSDQACFDAAWALGNPWADCNGDGTLTPEDKACYALVRCKGCPTSVCLPKCYDCDGDGDIDIADFICHATLQAIHIQSGGVYLKDYDCDCNGVLNANDLSCTAASVPNWCVP